MAFRGIKDVIDAEINGQVRQYGWRKTPSQTTTAATWFDLSMSPGNPPPKYWFDAPPGIAKAVYQSTDGGLYHGANASPSTKYLRRFTALTATATALPLSIILCDYLLYYPSMDDSTTDPQVMDNTVTLPRYTDGAGVQMIVVSVAGRTGGANFTISYTNSEGVSGRTSQLVSQNSSAAIGTIVSSWSAFPFSANPFMGLQSGDTGVRSVQSVTMGATDVGLFSIILVKPIATTLIRGIDAPVEKDFLIQSEQLPVIQDNAYLSMLCLPQGTLAATALIGDMKVTWD